MMKLMVYSHDAFGLGNIRRMLAICQHLLKTIPDLSILVISGSPALHSLRLPQGLDYIKLPCLGRDCQGQAEVRYLKNRPEEVVTLRSQLILAAATHFQPDVLLVDKKPHGLHHELRDTLDYLSRYRPQTRRVLLLRDILDSPAATVAQWQRSDYYRITQEQYDQIWVVGLREVFDLPQEYHFPLPLSRRVRFCGYLEREPGGIARSAMRQQLSLENSEPLVVVTPGGGRDGFPLLHTYLRGLARQPKPFKTVMISGPEMSVAERQRLITQTQRLPTVKFMEFSDDLISYLSAADVVVGMAGYNTACEILTLRKPAVAVPRTHPSQEQQLRARRFAQLGLLHELHPTALTPKRLFQAIATALQSPTTALHRFPLNGLDRIAQLMLELHPTSVAASTPERAPERTLERTPEQLPCAL